MKYIPVLEQWTVLCPDRWLDESQRFEKQRLQECVHYRNAIRNAFASMNLQVEEIVDTGETKQRLVRQVKLGFCYMDEPSGFYAWRVDRMPVGLRPERLLEPHVERNLALGLHAPVRVKGVKNYLWILVGQEPDPERVGRLPDRVAYADMTPPGEP